MEVNFQSMSSICKTLANREKAQRNRFMTEGGKYATSQININTYSNNDGLVFFLVPKLWVESGKRRCKRRKHSQFPRGRGTFSKDWHGNFDLSTFDFPWDGQAGLEVPPRTFYVVIVCGDKLLRTLPRYTSDKSYIRFVDYHVHITPISVFADIVSLAHLLVLWVSSTYVLCVQIINALIILVLHFCRL